ncbi:MAG: hypothetical protein IT182_05345 [Acidobacteria bacterium]|nr:hypothetical protein [Acidobacteriota bacterium]
MDIHFISSLNPDDEDRVAQVVLAAVRPILEVLPIAYTVRIRTATNNVYQHTKAEIAPSVGVDPPRTAPAMQASGVRSE